MLPTKFRVNWPIVSGEEVKNRFSKWLPWQPSWNSIKNALAIFDLQVTLTLPTKLPVNWPIVQEKKWKTDFQDGHHGGLLAFPISITLAFFDLQVTLTTPTKFQVNLPFGSGEKAKKKKISRWQPSWISKRNDFSYFWSTRHPDASYQVSSQLAFRFRRRSEKQIFKMAAIFVDFRSE